jgi:lipid-A-disaccharide synthase
MKYYIIAGEASGDLHGSNLIRELKNLDHYADFRVWGGDKMKAEGAFLVKHYKDLAFMGFTEVLKNLSTIFENIRFCKQDIIKYQPDALILIDYPGFNLRIARWARIQHLKVIFYISPQLWAWNESRVKVIKKSVDKMLVILPFEKEFYRKHGFEVEYVGHPLVEVIENYRMFYNNGLQNRFPPGWPGTVSHQPSLSNEQTNVPGPVIDKERFIIALLPGSRKQELELKLPIMLEVAKHFPNYSFVVAKAPGIEDSFYDRFLKPYQNVSAISDQTYFLLSKAKAALVTSGTATLETALFGVPEIVCYKGNELSYQLAKRLIKIKFISLVNLIMNKEVVKELIQKDLTVKNLVEELNKILNDQEKQNKMATDYMALRKLLSQGGNASANAAKAVYKLLT